MRAYSAHDIPFRDVVLTLGGISAPHHRAFDSEVLRREFPGPSLTTDSLITGAGSFGLRVKQRSTALSDLAAQPRPVWGGV
jgi:hypothetical protein